MKKNLEKLLIVVMFIVIMVLAWKIVVPISCGIYGYFDSEQNGE